MLSKCQTKTTCTLFSNSSYENLNPNQALKMAGKSLMIMVHSLNWNSRLQLLDICWSELRNLCYIIIFYYMIITIFIYDMWLCTWVSYPPTKTRDIGHSSPPIWRQKDTTLYMYFFKNISISTHTNICIGLLFSYEKKTKIVKWIIYYLDPILFSSC